MSYLTKHGIPKVALDFINDDHEEAARLISEINQTIAKIEIDSNDKNLILPLLETLLGHKGTHFEKEESSMKEAQFPAISQHKQEHDRLLNELKALIDHWKHYQDTHSLKTYMNEIFPLWLKNHTITMDHATALFITSP
ncbi:hemerythrin family protein [Neptunomonas japonica]|uniref:hemerythrin family protein n=1 Tax=Neptunomonas japonica TaxID=417574 RepID=UPI00042A5C3A|nr:hemerythrin family protein [Neptunomonas japonica]